MTSPDADLHLVACSRPNSTCKIEGSLESEQVIEACTLAARSLCPCQRWKRCALPTPFQTCRTSWTSTTRALACS